MSENINLTNMSSHKIAEVIECRIKHLINTVIPNIAKEVNLRWAMTETDGDHITSQLLDANLSLVHPLEAYGLGALQELVTLHQMMVDEPKVPTTFADLLEWAGVTEEE